MARIQDIMTGGVTVAAPDTTLQDAAKWMRELNVGALPVCENDRLVGIVTDRDIAVRGVAAGKRPAEARVAEVMTESVHSCRPDDASDSVLKRMGEWQVRRLAVLDADRRIVGIVALGDFAVRQSAPTDDALRGISEPSPVA
jgi:CBS-domain-containing membrane protein